MRPGPGVNPGAPEVTIAPQIATGAGVGIVLEVFVRHPGPQPAQLTHDGARPGPGWVPAPMMIALQPGRGHQDRPGDPAGARRAERQLPVRGRRRVARPAGRRRPGDDHRGVHAGRRQPGAGDPVRRPGPGDRRLRPQGPAADHQPVAAGSRAHPATHCAAGDLAAPASTTSSTFRRAGRSVCAAGSGSANRGCSGPARSTPMPSRSAGRVRRWWSRATSGPGRCSAARWSGQSRLVLVVALWVGLAIVAIPRITSYFTVRQHQQHGRRRQRARPAQPAPTARRVPTVRRAPTAPPEPTGAPAPMVRPGADGAAGADGGAGAAASGERLQRAGHRAESGRRHRHPGADQPDRGRRGRRRSGAGRHRRGHRVRPAGGRSGRSARSRPPPCG